MSKTQHGLYYSTWGPLDGPIRGHHSPPAISIVSKPGGGFFPIGTAYPGAYRPDPPGPIALFRLVVGEQELPGPWECVAREFVPAAE
jgi:hypothetical protein